MPNHLTIEQRGERWYAIIQNNISKFVHHEEDVTLMLADKIVAATEAQHDRFQRKISSLETELKHLKEALTEEREMGVGTMQALDEKGRNLLEMGRKLNEQRDTNAAIAEANERLQAKTTDLLERIKLLTGERNLALNSMTDSEREVARLRDALTEYWRMVGDVFSGTTMDDLVSASELHRAFTYSLNRYGYSWPNEVPWYDRWTKTNKLMREWDDLQPEEKAAFVASWRAARDLLVREFEQATGQLLPRGVDEEEDEIIAL